MGREIKTTSEYRRLARLYITPHLGSRPIAKLKPAHVDEWTALLRRSGGRGGAALSAKTVHSTFSLLNAALKWAVRMELAGRNVCDAATRPTMPKSAAKAFESGEIVKLLATATGTRWEAFVALALTTGARRAELLALSWSDISNDGKSVTISKALSQVDGAIRMKGTKSGKTRTLPLSQMAAAALRKQRAFQAAETLRNRLIYRVDPTGPIFTNEIGDRLTPQAATSAFAKIARKAGLSSTRLHDLRHTAGSHLLAAGIDLKTASAVLGHASPNVTLAVYAHVLEGGTRAAVDVLGERLERIVKDAG